MATGLSREIGRYEELLEAGLPGLEMAMITACFQMEGIEADRL